MSENILMHIENEKKLTKLHNINNLNIYKTQSIDNYLEVIGLVVNVNLSNWKEIEEDFTKYLETQNKIDESYVVEPIMIFLINEENYVDNLKNIIDIERDEYYCRKFIISLTENITDIVNRLPIGSPLEGIKVRHQFLTARQRLIGMDIDRKIINQLHELRQTENKLRDLKEYFNTDLVFNKQRDISKLAEYTPKTNKIIIKNITVEGFRIYNHANTFDFDADLIVLYGHNGLGKTSLFDAFEYCITGEIKRYSGDKNLIHKNNIDNSNNNNSSIQMTFQDVNYREIKVVRNVGSREASLNEEVNKRRSSIIKEITGSDLGMNQKNYIKLFRATHINSQEDSELTEDALNNKKSNISKEILGKMISFEDYTIVEENLRKLMDSLDKDLKPILERHSSYMIEIDDLVKEKEKYSFNKEKKYSDTVERLRLEISNKLKNLGITFNMNLDEKADVNELLLIIKKTIKDNEKKLMILKEDNKTFEEIEKLENSLREIKYPELLDSIMQKKSKLSECESSQQNLIKKDQELKEDIKTVELLLYELDVFIDKHQNLKKINFHINGFNKEIVLLEVNIAKLTEAIKEVNIKLLNAKKRKVEIEKEKEEFEIMTNNVKICLNFFPEFISIKESLKENITRREILSKKLEKERNRYNYLNNENLKLTKRESDLEIILKNEKSKNDELEEVLMIVKKYVKDGICPVCNTQHSNNQIIFDSIDTKTKKLTDRMKTLINQKHEVSNSVKSISDQQYTLRKSINELTNEIDSIEVVVKNNNIKIGKYEKQLSELYLPISKEKIENRLNLLINKMNGINNSIVQLDIDNLELRKSKLEIEQEDYKEKKDNLKLLIGSNKLDSKKITEQLLNLNNYERFTNKTDFNREKYIRNFNEKKRGFVAESKEIGKNLDIVNNKVNSLRKEIELLMKEKYNYEYLEKEIHNAKLRLRYATLEEVNKETVKLIKNQQEFKDIESSIFMYSDLVNYAMLETKQKELSEKIREIENKIKENQKEQKRITKIKDNIIKLKELIVEYQLNITEDYCSEVEPLLNSIQGRLRNLYGFSDISLITNKKKNEVEVRFNFIDNLDKELKPSDYLSEGQKNILNLSLFLSTTLSQNWSNLSTILLDDPIRNFDDLNSYAFLELLKDLIITKKEIDRKQIIISTCDKQFFKLLQQKFSKLYDQGRAKYYNFISLDTNGPVTEKI